MCYSKIAFKTLILGVAILITAAKNGYTDVVDILLEHGAEANTKNKDGKLFPFYLFATSFLFIIYSY